MPSEPSYGLDILPSVAALRALACLRWATFACLYTLSGVCHSLLSRIYYYIAACSRRNAFVGFPFFVRCVANAARAGDA